MPLLTVLYTLQQEGGTGSAALWGVQVSLLILYQSPTIFSVPTVTVRIRVVYARPKLYAQTVRAYIYATCGFWPGVQYGTVCSVHLLKVLSSEMDPAEIRLIR